MNEKDLEQIEKRLNKIRVKFKPGVDDTVDRLLNRCWYYFIVLKYARVLPDSAEYREAEAFLPEDFDDLEKKLRENNIDV